MTDERPDNGTAQPGSSAPEAPAPQQQATDTASIVRDAIKAEEAKDKPTTDQAPTRDADKAKAEEFFLKSWKTRDDAEKGVVELMRKLTEQGNQLKEFEAKVAAISQAPEKEQPAAGTDEGTIELTKEELAELMKEDPQTFLEYMTAKITDQIQKQVAPQLDEKLKPIEEMRKKASEEAWKSEQTEYEKQTKELFGDRYDHYAKMRQDPAMLEKAIQESPAGEQIINLWNSGKQAQAIRILYREFEHNELLEERKARQRSTKAEPSTTSSEPVSRDGKKQSIADIVRDEMRRASA